MQSSRRIIVQHDWNDIVAQSRGKFWVAHKQPGVTSNQALVDCIKRPDGSIDLVADSPSFKISHRKLSIRVSYTDDVELNGTTLTTTFFSPSKRFNLHGSNRKVNVLDVTDGGLGLSSCENSSSIYVWEAKTGVKRRELVGHVGDIYCAKFFPSGVVVLSGSSDTQLKIWSAETGSCAATITGHKAGVNDVAFVERGRNIISCSRDGTARIWDVSKQQCIYAFHGDLGVVNSCDLYSTDAVNHETGPATINEQEVGTTGKLLLLACENKKVVGFSLNSKQQVLDVVYPEDSVNCVKFISNNYYVFGTQDGAVCLHDLRNNREPLKVWKEGRSSVLSLHSHADGFIYSTGDGSVVAIDSSFRSKFELCGPDCDAVYKVSSAASEVFTCSRDGFVRTYDLSMLSTV